MINLYNQIQKQYPPISTLEEERRLITVERHDEARCRELLVLHNIGLARTMGAQFAKICGGYEDAVQIAMIGLIRASEKFDLDKNIKFSTYASFSILGKLGHQEVNKGQIMNNVLCMSMNRPVRASNTKARDSDTEELAEFIGKMIEPRYKEQTKFEYDPQKDAEKSDSIRYIEKIINGLKCEPQAKNIVKEYIGIIESAEFEGQVTLKLLGVKYGKTREQIRQVLEETYELIKRELLKVPDYKLAIAGRGKKKRQAWNNVRYSKPTSESVRYKRIEDEGVKEVGSWIPKKKNLKHHRVISGFSNFYCDRYQEMMRVLTRQASIAKRTNSNVAYTLSLQAALQRRKAQFTQTDSVSAVVTTKAPDVTFAVQSAPPEKEPPMDTETEEMLQSAVMDSEEAFRIVEDAIVEQSEITDKGFGIGALEDDGDLDYEVESA